MKIASHNITKGLHSKIASIEETMNKHNIDIISLAESDLPENGRAPVSKGYQEPLTHKNPSKYTKVVCYVKDGITFTRPDQILRLNYKESSLSITIDLRSIMVTMIYNEHTKGAYSNQVGARISPKEQASRIRKLLTACNIAHKKNLVLGDMNIDTNKPTTTAAIYSNVLSKLGFTHLVAEPIRGEACLDHILSRGVNHRSIETTEVPFKTDHKLVGIELGQAKQTQKISTSKLVLAPETVRTIQLPPLELINLNDDIQRFTEIVKELEKAFTFLKSVRPAKLWFRNSELTRVNKQIKAETDPRKAIKLKTRGTNLCRRTKRDAMTAEISKSGYSAFWKLVKRRTKPIAVQTQAGAITDPKEVTKILAEKFGHAQKVSDPNLNATIGAKRDVIQPKPPWEFRQITENEMDQLIKRLQSKKSTSPDVISFYLLKTLRIAIKNQLTALVNQISKQICWAAVIAEAKNVQCPRRIGSSVGKLKSRVPLEELRQKLLVNSSKPK